ncbi:MAG: fibronectin type III domain-containing protein [Acidobacteriota bacterium]|nr:fibronectin type III domain-containing protein [Acidobacteriota bacterium]
MSSIERAGWAALAGVLAAALAGCGTPGAPQAPSLNLPGRVTDLAAERAGNQVSLKWTMPTRNTDKLLLTNSIDVRVCRKEGAGTCDAVGGGLMLAPGADGALTETLPPALASGAPRMLTYFVELKNRKGRSAGLSNAAPVLAGAAPAPVTGLSAEVRKTGVELRWTPDAEDTAVRLRRKLLSAQPKPKQGLLAQPPEPTEQNLLVETGVQTGRAMDKTIRFGETYEYRAQRVARVTADGRALELVGELSAPIRVEALDVFPPTVPTGLAAVATTDESGGSPAIDLSWQPDGDTDLAGYVVYRREGDAAWQRISPAPPVAGPAFHDAQVQPGHTYRYAVTAVDQKGHESARSAEAQETVPNP